MDQGITDRASPGHEGPRARKIEAKSKPSDKLARIREAPPRLHSALERAAEREREPWMAGPASPTQKAATARAESLLIEKLRHMPNVSGQCSWLPCVTGRGYPALRGHFGHRVSSQAKAADALA